MSVPSRIELQGFDDAYFGNSRQTKFRSERQRAAYDAAFTDGVKQRRAANVAEAKAKERER